MNPIRTRTEIPPNLKKSEDELYLTEEEEEALEEKHRRWLIKLARGCLEMAVLMLILAGVFILLEQRGNLSVLYVLPPYTLSLSCVAASFFSIMAGLFTIRRNAFAMLVMVLGGWMLLFVMAMIYFQEPETLTKEIPGSDHKITMTLVSSPIASSLYVEEPLHEYWLARRWKFRVHGKNIPLSELIELKQTEELDVALYYGGKLWAVCDAETGEWSDVLEYEAESELEDESTEKKK